jgi:hypothetical protein
MSLIFCDGFDDGLFTSKWTLFPNHSIVAAKNGNGLRIASFCSVAKIVPASYEHNTFIVGFALRMTALPGTTVDIFALRSDNNTTSHEILQLTSSGTLNLQRAGGVNVGPTISINLNTWYYMEIKALLSDTVGTLEWRIDGSTIYSGTGLDTKGGGTKTVFDSVFFFSNHVSQAMIIDDFYLCNGAGSTNNNFLGAIAVETIYPDNNGNSSQFVGSDANSVDNYLLVDEAAPNTSDYVESATVGEKDTYSFANLTRTNGNVLAVQPTLYAQKSDAGARTARLVTRSSGTEATSDVKNLGIGWGAHMYPYDQDPNGNINWTISSANAAEFGFQVDS